MKQGDKIVFTAEAYSNAETVGMVDGITVFVPQMLVGEKALVRVDYAKKNIAYGTVVQLLQASPNRQQPPCNKFGKCGGCSLMHMTYAEQLLFKQNKVRNNLEKIGKLNVEVLPCQPSQLVLSYRNKLSLPVRGSAGNVRIGMFQRSSHLVVDGDNCLLGDKWSQTLVALFRRFLNQNKIAPYNEKTFHGTVRHLVARFVEGQLLVVVVCNGTTSANWLPLYEVLHQHFEKVGLFVNENTLKNNVILGPKTIHIAGLQHIEGTHLGVHFQLRPESFFQVNDFVKDGIYSKVKQLLDLSHTQVLVDCFSGIGILTTVLASPNYQTFAVEIEPAAVADANRLVQLNNTPNVTNICGDVTVQLPQIAAQNKGKIMSLVVDPPRKGLGPTICQTVLDAQFDNIVYISCDSATLARDLQMLSQNYTVNYVQPWDMFPNTAEVETLVHLSKKQ